MNAFPLIHVATAVSIGLTLGMALLCALAVRPFGLRSSVGSFLLASVGLFLLSLGQLGRAVAPSLAWMEVSVRVSQAASLIAIFGISEVYRFAAPLPFSRAYRVGAALLAALVVYSLASPGGLLMTKITALGTKTYPWGETVAVPIAEYSPELFFEVLALGFCLLLMGRASLSRLERAPNLRSLAMLASVLLGATLLAVYLRRWFTHDKSPSHVELGLLPVLVLAALEALDQHRRFAFASKSALAGLRESESRFSALVDNAQTLSGLLDPEGRVVVVNQRALAVIGSTLEDVVGKPFASTNWWAHSSALQNRVKLSVERAAHGDVDRFQGTHATLDGGELVVDFSLTPYRDEFGKIKWLIAEGRDVTDLVKYQERARAEQRLEVIGQLAGGVAHDFNNMLSGIIGAAELARAEASEPEVIDNLSVVLSAAERAASLTKQLLHFARRGGTRNETYLIDDHVKATTQLFERTSGKALRVETLLASGDSRILGDPALLQSAVLNLLVNARDAIGEGGSIRVSTKRRTLDAISAARLNQPVEPGEYIELSVLDSGCGIPKDVLPKIFEPFFTTKEIGKGTGLGLAAVLSSIRDHRGAVDVESKVGEGTRFDIYLPVASSATDNESKIRSYAPAYAHGRKALLVDDEPIVRNSMTRMLKHLGYTVTTEEDGISALTHIEADTTFELAVLDYHMPQMNGAELATELRARFKELPIVIMSGNFGDRQLEELKRDPNSRQLAKPARREDLVTVLLELGAIDPRS